MKIKASKFGRTSKVLVDRSMTIDEREAKTANAARRL